MDAAFADKNDRGEDGPILAVMLDVDNFKNINDTFGHHTGDKILKQAAHRIASVFDGEHYETFRIGGDEFAVIAADVTVEDLESRLAQLEVQREGLACSFSYGYARIDLAENNSMENAFMRADSNMYLQKKAKKIPGAGSRV